MPVHVTAEYDLVLEQFIYVNCHRFKQWVVTLQEKVKFIKGDNIARASLLGTWYSIQIVSDESEI